MAWIATLALGLAAWLAFAIATSLLVALVWPALRQRMWQRHPASRARAALLAAIGPSLVPTLLVLVCLAPGLAVPLGSHQDHCAHHTDHHPHLCLVHPTAALTAPLGGLLVLAICAAFGALGLGVTRLARMREHLAALRFAATESLAPDVGLVASRRAFSLTAGIVRPEIWISTALAQALPHAQLDVVVEHERAHARRRDPLRRLAAAVLSLPLWPGVRRDLLAHLSLAVEQACDEEAGRRVGDRLRVAETILAVERVLGRSRRPHSAALLAFGGSAVPDRVRSLLGEHREPGTPLHFWGGAAALMAGAWLAADPLHHATEHLLSLLLRAF